MSLSLTPPPFSVVSTISHPMPSLSVSFTLFTHPRPTPTQTFVSGSDNGSRQQANPLASAALYLYTFLATLLLLVGISLFIVIRTVVQRQRRNRAVRAALSRYRDGSTREGDLELVRLVGMNQAAARGTRVDTSKVPRMWEVQLAPTPKLSVLEKTAEGKLISSSWKSHHQSNPHLDLKSNPYPGWSWSSILPLSSTLLSPDGDSTDAGSATMDERSVPLSSMGRLLGRMLHGSGSGPTFGHRNGRGAEGAHDQSRPNAPASASSSPAAAVTTSNTTNANSVDPVDGSPPSDNRPSMDTPTEADRRLEEGTHIHGSSGSSSSSSSHPHPLNSNLNVDKALPNITTATERADSGSNHPLDQRRGQVDDGETHISHQIPSDLHQSRNQTQNPNQSNQNQNQNQHHKKSSGTRTDVMERLQVAVLVRMPTAPPASASAPSLLSGLSRAKKAKAKAESGFGRVDEKRSSASSSVSSFGGGKQRDMGEMEIEMEVPTLEVGLADVDVSSDFGGAGRGVESGVSSWR